MSWGFIKKKGKVHQTIEHLELWTDLNIPLEFHEFPWPKNNGQFFSYTRTKKLWKYSISSVDMFQKYFIIEKMYSMHKIL